MCIRDRRLQRARAYSQLPADLLAREPSFHVPCVAFAPQGGYLLRKCAERRHHHLEGLFLDRYYLDVYKRQGMSKSEWVRKSAILRKITPRFTEEQLKAFRASTGASNNLNQLTKKAHQSEMCIRDRVYCPSKGYLGAYRLLRAQDIQPEVQCID